MLDNLLQRLYLSDLEISLFRDITNKVTARMVIDEYTIITVIDEGSELILELPDHTYDCESPAEAAALIFHHLDYDPEIPRLSRDRLQALADAVRHGKEDTAKVILEVTTLPEDSYESILHILKAGMKIGEDRLLREMGYQENENKAYPYPEYYEPQY
jgi:hypothetical protein